MHDLVEQGLDCDVPSLESTLNQRQFPLINVASEKWLTSSCRLAEIKPCVSFPAAWHSLILDQPRWRWTPSRRRCSRWRRRRRTQWQEPISLMPSSGRPPALLRRLRSRWVSLQAYVEDKRHCKLATLSRRQKPMLPGRWYLSMSPAGQQSLQFYNEFIKWWAEANIFQCCPRATLENIGFGSPLDKASLYQSVLKKGVLCEICWS